MWYILVMFPSEDNTVRRIDRRDVESSGDKNVLVEFASMLNKRERYEGRYFVVHEDELSLFGIKL